MAFAPTAPALPASQIKPLVRFETYTVATLPDATLNKGIGIIVTNGNAGSPCLALSDGINWFPVTVGSTACAAS